jgi:hypothetical protein
MLSNGIENVEAAAFFQAPWATLGARQTVHD